MASAIDSGVDTGNDSSDSSVQEKLSKMDLENSPPSKSPTSDSGKETTSEEEQEDRNQPQSSSGVSMQESASALSLSHFQPARVIHGYECYPPPSPPETRGRNISCVVFNMSPKDIEDVGGKYAGSQLVTKLHRYHRNMLRLKCLRTSSCPVTYRYAKVKDTMKMCRAACHNNTEAMRQMLASGVSPNCQDAYKRSPLHLAACTGYTDMVKLLLEHGADPNAKDSIGNTPLHLAACTNHVSVVTLLLRAGTRVSERDLAGHSPLQLAITKFNIMKRSLVPHPVLKDQVCQVIAMLTEYMRRKEGATIDPELLNKFESMVRVSDSTEEVESNIRDLLSNLSSLSLDPS